MGTTNVPFHFGEKPLWLLFNCFFCGARVIINFAQGDKNEREGTKNKAYTKMLNGGLAFSSK